MKLYESSNIRNVALLGHGGCGKTSLTECMLYISGATTRKGKVETGNTVSDFDTEEIKRNISIRTSVVPIEWKEHKLNILDTPGYFDFVGGIKEAMRVADAAVIMMRATAGIEVGTEKAWDTAEEAGVPRFIFVTEMEAPYIDYEQLLEQCKQKFGTSIAPLQVPWYENNRFIGYIHAVKQIARRFEGDKVIECPVPSEYVEAMDKVRTMIVEAVVGTDEELMEKYFAEEEITIEEIEVALKKGVQSGEIVPVFCGSAVEGAGVRTLMDHMMRSFPEPKAQRQTESEKKDEPSLFVFKTIVDHYIGKLSLFKVCSGSVTKDMILTNLRTNQPEKVSHLYVLKGKEQEEVASLNVGDIGAIAKAKDILTSDTLAKGECEPYEAIHYPKPYVKMAILPVGKGDEEKMSQALSKLATEDPTFYSTYDKETGESVIYGIGEQHLEVIVNRLKDKFKVEVLLKTPTTHYRETIKGRANVRGKHKKQSGGHGQYGDVVMDFEPSGDLEMPYVFEEKIFGGAVPRQYFPAVEKGLDECTTKGVLAGYPVVGVKAILKDGSYHPVDSSEMAFKMATTIAFKEGILKAQPVILEPIAHVEISVPEVYTGDIMGDMKKRRGRLIGMSLEDKKQVIVAEVPMSQLYRYATDVRSMTQGRGELAYWFERYEEVPREIQEKVINDRKVSV